jgi:tRNA(Arg) A34 adenosine deaminase TadA
MRTSAGLDVSRGALAGVTESPVMSDARASVLISWPEWIHDTVTFGTRYHTDEDRMQLAIELARQNVVRGTGGPFGAAIFERSTGALLSVGVNSVVRLNNSTLHGEMVAIMMAQHRIGSYTLAGSPDASYELFSSCDPCAMCLGAVLWSGVKRMVTGADRDDAAALSFEEGPVFPQSYTYLEERGVTIQRSVLRREAAGVLELYRRQGGQIYNA